MILGTWHFSFHVSDIEQSEAFYRDVLGLELVLRQDQANEYTASLVGYPNASLRVAQFKFPDLPSGTVSSHTLELVEYVHPRGERHASERCNTGTAHFAMRVDDIWAEYNRLVAAGVTFISPPNDITSGVNAGGGTCYFVDPDGITLELVQAPQRPAA
jgi:catechol 2,3-dioxygenase-like lactoylglutathione lyase family enzyme